MIQNITPKEEECNILLKIGDDYGDNECTMRCQEPNSHRGLHQEQYKSQGNGQVTVTWEHEDKEDENGS